MAQLVASGGLFFNFPLSFWNKGNARSDRILFQIFPCHSERSRRISYPNPSRNFLPIGKKLHFCKKQKLHLTLLNFTCTANFTLHLVILERSARARLCLALLRASANMESIFFVPLCKKRPYGAFFTLKIFKQISRACMQPTNLPIFFNLGFSHKPIPQALCNRCRNANNCRRMPYHHCLTQARFQCNNIG